MSGGQGTPAPPRWARRLVARVVPGAAREAVLGDLQERYSVRAARDGRAAADRWYRRQAVGFLLRVPLERARALRVGRGASTRAVARSYPHRPRPNGPANEDVARGVSRGHGPQRRPAYHVAAFGHELRMAWRTLLHAPGTAVLAVATIAVSMAAATVIFSVFEGVLLRPLPYRAPQELANVWLMNAEFLETDSPESRLLGERFPVSYPVYEAWRDLPSSPFVALAAHETFRPTIGEEEGDRVAAIRTNDELFDVLGVEPLIGRTFSAAEDEVGGPRVAVLTDAMWRGRFGGDEAILGRTVLLGGTTHTIVGVMPPGFYFPSSDVEVLVPFYDRDRTADANTFGLQLVGRLRPGLTAADAQRELTAVADRIGRQAGVYLETAPATVLPRRELVVGDVEAALSVLMATVLIVLLIACVNVANLLLVSATGRRREYAVRAALGAGGGRLARQLLLETSLIALAGGAAGLVAAVLALDPLLSLVPEGALPRVDEIELNGAVALFALAASAGTALLAGVLPALQAARSEPAAVLQGGRSGHRGRGTIRVQRALVMVEVVAAFVLLVGGGLLVNSYARLTAVDPGYDADRLITAELYVPRGDGSAGADALARLERIAEQLRALPAVRDVGVGSDGPYSGSVRVSTLTAEQADGSMRSAPGVSSAVVPGYLQALGARFVAGGDVGAPSGDVGAPPGGNAGAPSDGPPQGVVVTRTAARRLWGTDTPLGRRLRLGDDPGEPFYTVAGVVEDMRLNDLAEDPGAHVFAPMFSAVNAYVAVRTATPPETVLASVRAALAEMEPGVRVLDVALLRDKIDASLVAPRFRTTLLAALASVAGLLAVLGIYGVMSFSVTLARGDMGVRMALGARPAGVLRAVVGRALTTTLAGILVGTAIALPAARFLEGLLFGIQASDPATFVAVSLGLLMVAAAAAYVPARRAARVDPAHVLRTD